MIVTLLVGPNARVTQAIVETADDWLTLDEVASIRAELDDAVASDARAIVIAGDVRVMPYALAPPRTRRRWLTPTRTRA